MKIKIKQVPNSEPNADGVWIEKEVDNCFFVRIKNFSQIFEELTKLCDVDNHAVSYEIITEA